MALTSAFETLRAPGDHLHAIRTRTWVIEGENGNSGDVHTMKMFNTNDRLRFWVIDEGDHFSILHPINQRIAEALRDGPAGVQIDLSRSDLQRAWAEAKLQFGQ